MSCCERRVRSDRWSEWRRKAREVEGGRDDDDIVGDRHGGWSP